MTVTADRARELHDADDTTEGSLAGVPVAIKDLQPVAGMWYTHGSVPLANNVPRPDGRHPRPTLPSGRCRDRRQDEHARVRTQGDNRKLLFGPITSPYGDERNAGGSSVGAAAAAAEGPVSLAQGGDRGRSIRIPATCCNVFGSKPSFGRVLHETCPNALTEHKPFISRRPLSRTVADARRMLDVIVGPDDRDPLSLPDDGVDFESAASVSSVRTGTGNTLNDLSIAFSLYLGGFPVEDEVRDVVAEAVHGFEEARADVSRGTLGFEHDREELDDVWYVQYEVLNAHLAEMIDEEYDIDHLGTASPNISDVFAELIEGGRDRSALEYRRADRVRSAAYDAVASLFKEYNFLVAPTLATAGIPQRGENTVGPTSVAGKSVNPLVGFTLTWVFNLTGYPVVAAPAGFVDDRTPFGLQVVTPCHDKERMLRACAAFERSRPLAGADPHGAPRGE